MSNETGTSTLSDSYTETTEVLLPNNTNTLGRALGGAVLHWMDMCGTVAAGRFANEQVVTASLEHADFISPLDLGEIAVLEAYVFDTGRTSIHVWVEVNAENPRVDETRRTASSALTFVAIDGSGEPTPVPELVCDEAAEAELREHAREQRREQLERLTEHLD